jgi:hypothetical protein
MIRTECIVCGYNEGFEPIYTQANYPISICSSTNPAETDIFDDLVFVGCPSCGCVQLQNPIDPLVLYANSHNNTFETPTWYMHHREFSRFITEERDRDKYLEIGGGSGILAHSLCDKIKNVKIKVMDLNDSQFFKTLFPIQYIQANCETYDYTQVDPTTPILMSHVFEHLYNPREFLKRIQDAKIETIFISVPNLEICLQQEFLSFLHVEHTYYCSKDHILRMFYDAGYTCKRIKEFKNHSLFFEFTLSPDITSELVPSYPIGYALLEQFRNYYAKRDTLFSSIQLTQPTYIVPAGHYGQLIYFYLRNQKEFILGFLDNDKSKIDMRMYGTEKYVYPMTQIKESTEKVSVLLNAGPYATEIKQQLIALSAHQFEIDFISVG